MIDVQKIPDFVKVMNEHGIEELEIGPHAVRVRLRALPPPAPPREPEPARKK